MEEHCSIFELYRNDRRKLLEFILSCPNLIREVRTPHGPAPSISSLSLDSFSADYVLSCINSGGILDVSKAIEDYYHESAYPVTIHSQSRTTYFTLSDPNSCGSPPRRMPPSVDVAKRTNHTHHSFDQTERTLEDKIVIQEDRNGVEHACNASNPFELSEVGTAPLLGLPSLQTGLSDDDLGESAYEMLVASMVLFGLEVLPNGDRKREKSSKLLSGLKGKREKVQIQPQERHFELLNIIRVQMEISEATDLCIRNRLMRCISRTSGGQINIFQIVLGLLNSVSRSDFLNDKLYNHWKNRQANILVELLSSLANNSMTEYLTVQHSVGKIRSAREWDLMSSTERCDVLTSIRDFVSKVLSREVVGGQSCYVADGYHLKIRLYEKLLYVIFDILEEGQILTEADEILTLLKLTWSILGITRTIHDTLHGWVLFEQFVQTGEEVLLEYASLQMQKAVAAEPCQQEEQYQELLLCTRKWQGRKIRSSLVPSIYFSMAVWCDQKLQDYHVHFSQKTSKFRRMLTFSLLVGVFSPNQHGELMKSDNSIETRNKRFKIYVERSVQAAYMRVTDNLDLKSKLEGKHPLAVLAEGLKMIAQKEFALYSPVLHEWFPDAGMISSTLLYQLFWEKLKPFFGSISCLSQDVRQVLAAAHMLDLELTQLHFLSLGDSDLHNCLAVVLDHYQIGEVSGPLILDWVISKHAHILDWIGRAFDLEDWEPLSSQQKQAVSVVEVFRMLEETVDQFFGLNLPVNITHLQALISVIVHSLDSYLSKMANQLVDKSLLYPVAPPLTRHEEALVPIVRKKLAEHMILDDKVNDMLNRLTISNLCIRLNTLQYVKNQIGVLEEGIRKSWGRVRPAVKRRWFNIVEEDSSETLGRTMQSSDESIDELFVNAFEGIRSAVTDVAAKVNDFIGPKVVFWDLREPFILHLYHDSVEGARMDSVLSQIDAVLNQICGLLNDALRDPVVLSIFRASLEGYLWVLLDGGPSRAFLDSDVTMMEEDLNALKDFFVADGQGLPRSVVERETRFAHQVLNLFSYQTSTVIQMLMSASERISTRPELDRQHRRSLDDANTLIRILCHKKDREASKFLKRQYRLPPSSEYDDASTSESASSSPAMSDLLKRSASLRWPSSGHNSFKLLKKKFQEAW